MTIITPEEAQKLLDEATPGPWQKRDCDVVIGDGLTSKTLCHFWRHWSNDEAGIEQTEPNARLTAAAPDLARSLIATHAELTKMTAERDRFAATIVHLVEDRNAEKARADAQAAVALVVEQAARDARDVFSDHKRAKEAVDYMEQLIYAAVRALEPVPPVTTWHERRTMLPDGDARKEEG